MTTRTAFMLVAVWTATVPSTVVAQQIVYVVRHAEKADESADSALSSAGEARAQELARVLGDAGVDVIYTSNLRRTVSTAEPLAARLGGLVIKKEFAGVEQALVDQFAARLREQHSDDRVLVVGHSNTVPMLLQALGHDPTPALAIGPSDFDNLFVVVLKGAESPIVSRLRYGR